MDTPTQIFLMKFSGEVLENSGDIFGLNEFHKKRESTFYHFPIIESLLPTFQTSRRTSVFIPRVESHNGLMRERVYDLTVEVIISREQPLLKCTIEDLTEYYIKGARIQQRIQEEAIAIQTEA